MVKLNTVNKDVQPQQRVKKGRWRQTWRCFKDGLVNKFNKAKQFVKEK